ncbi:MAG: hypothetical protein SNJ76_07585 [Fimbriimonadaceae bacterium]
MAWTTTLAAASACALVLLGGTCQRSPEPSLTLLAVSGSDFKVLQDGRVYLGLSLAGWGPNWSWAGWEASASPSEGGSRLDGSMRLSTGATLSLEGTLRSTGGRTAVLEVAVTSDRDTELTSVVLAVEPSDSFRGGSVQAEGRPPVAIPFDRQNFGASVPRLSFRDQAGRTTDLRLDPPSGVSADGNVRVAIAQNRLAAGQVARRRITLTFPDGVRLIAHRGAVPAEPGQERWFPLEVGRPGSGSDERSLADWLEAPAGRRGRIEMDGDHLVYGGERIRLWGVNVCFADCAPPKELAERRADFYARMGINAVRLHKYADGPGWAGIQSAEKFAEFDAAALDRMDYFVAQLKARGIFVKLSPTFMVKLGRGDREYVPYMDEFGRLGDARDARLDTRHGSIYLSRELQDLQIRQTVGILRHRNPYTGLTYAEDPAIAIVEMFNEDSALFFGTMRQLQTVPTLRRRASAQFTQWLRRKYGTEARLMEAWGPRSLNTFTQEGFTDESWDANTIVPAGNPWFFDPDQLEGSQRARARRLHDTMQFLYELQNDFYSRFERAVREAGYGGILISSNWIAGRAFSHFYNLDSDRIIGLVDRHNYFGGARGSTIEDASMLSRPGSGMLSTGMNQVAGRPFSLSEWIHVFPNEWGAEGPAILGAYGMGLQGWDVSFIFQNRDQGTFSDRIGRDQWDAVAPQVIGVFPAVSRQVLRGDVAASELVIPRNVHVPSLAEGRIGFDDRVVAAGDIKETDSRTVPIEALAIGRNVVRFTDRFEPTPNFDVERHISDGVVRSSTGQLRWHTGAGRQSGFIQIDTPGTQAVVGFAQGRRVALTDVEIVSRSRFAAIYATARGRDETIAAGGSVLLTAIARARNTGMKIFGQVLVERGQPPILMEPVVADITLKRPGATVHILDHDGRRTGRTVPVENGVVRIDTGRDRTCWYLVTFP